MLAFADEQTDDWALNRDVVYMLEENDLITFNGMMVNWRVQLTNKGCKAAKMGLKRYLKHQDRMEKLAEHEKFSAFTSAVVSIISMIITIILTIVNAKLTL